MPTDENDEDDRNQSPLRRRGGRGGARAAAPLIIKKDQIKLAEPERTQKRKGKVVVANRNQPIPEENDGPTFTESDDDSLDSEEEEGLNPNARRLCEVYRRSRAWQTNQSHNIFKVLITQMEPVSVIYTPVTTEQSITGKQRSLRWVALEFKLNAILEALTQQDSLSKIQPIVMQFLAFISSPQSRIPMDFLLPIENKLILFNEHRQRRYADKRDSQLLVGAFMFVKVLVGRVLFKPYKIADYFDKDLHDLERPALFKENCVALGYTMIALFTDFIFENYKVEFKQMNKSELKDVQEQIRVKNKIFQDLMPIKDDYVEYKDFMGAIGQNGWQQLAKKINTFTYKAVDFIDGQREFIEDSRLAGMQRIVRQEFNELVREKQKIVSEFTKNLQKERKIRDKQRAQAEDSDEEEYRQRAERIKHIRHRK